MQTLQPTLRLGRDVWNREAMPVEEFRGRADRLRVAMADRGLDALLLYGRNLNGCGHPTWLANYIVKLPFAALVVLPREGEAALMFEGATRGRKAAAATTWIEDVRPCWDMAATCLSVLTERGLTTARIGLAAMPRLVPHHEWQALAAGLAGASCVDAEALVNRERAVKSDREIAQIRRATAIVHQAFDSMAQTPRPTGEWRLVADVMRALRMQGAEDIRVLIARPQDVGSSFRPPEDVALREGETIGVLLAASWERYWSEAIRSFRVVAHRLEPAWPADLDARFHALIARLPSSATTGEWADATLAAMTPAESGAIAPYGFGHGIGITPEEWPPLAPRDQTPVQRGMCFVVRAAFESAGALVFHGQTVVV